MIIDNEIHPEKNIYYIGSILMDVFRSEPFGINSSINLYERVQNHLPYDLSFQMFLLTLDWLFILNLVEVTEDGDIKSVFK